MLGEKLSEDISNYGRKHSMPSSLIYEGAWAIMLSKLWNKEEVLYGLTVSGRNSDFPNITESTGLFMNVIPQKAYVDGNKEFSKWLYTYQKQINKRISHEDSELGDIQKWTDWPIHLPLFENLFVYGNFMRDELSIGEITIDHFEGGFTAAYPLSIRVNPTTKETELTFRYQSEKVSDELASWISTTYKNILSSIVKDDKSAIDNIPSYGVSLPEINVVRKTQRLASETDTDHSYEQIKKVYREIWIDILGIDNIATTDSFFDLGGTSLQAVTLVSQLEERLGYSYPPSLLLDKPTYGSLFDYLTSIREDAESPVVVKMKDGKPGTTPLICFHAGGTQIFFYKHFTEHLPDEIPVYSIQAPRMHDVADFPKDMSELTAYYIDEIKKVQPKGPYHLLGTCFSNAVILEMSHQLKAKGEKVERLYIIDSGPNELDYLGLESPKKRIRHAVKNMIKSIFPTKVVYKIEELVGSKGPQERAEMESLYKDNTLRATINILNDMFVLYEWKQTDTDIYLVRSEQFANDADKRFQTENWRKLTTGSLDIDVVPGTHLSIFDMPYAKGVAEAVAEYFPKD